MADYAIVLFRDPVDGDWIAAVPDLGNGVSAFGDTPAEALREIETVIPAVLDVMRERGEAPRKPRYRPAVATARVASSKSAKKTRRDRRRSA